MNNKSNYLKIVHSDKPIIIENFFNDKKNWIFKSENELEDKFINLLCLQGYKLLDQNTNLIENLKTQLEKLNDIKFTNLEWNEILSRYIDPESDGIDKKEKIKRFQNANSPYALCRDDGTLKNIYLFNKTRLLNNSFQVIRQYKMKNIEDYRYDVVILFNGIPVCQIELKNTSISIEKAFDQIVKYDQKSHIYSERRLFQYLQVYVISNYRQTRYFSNWVGTNSPSYKFTMNWSDSKNNHINELNYFAKTFLDPYALAKIIADFSILTSDNILKIMRPYQICATEKILNLIKITHSNKLEFKSSNTNGFIWHTTGSGKTLTSFKTAQLIDKLNFVNKILFVVDRQDLDSQTIREYENFQKGSSYSTSSTKKLEEILKKDNSENKIIITTIQKLHNLIKNVPNMNVYSKHNVIIFDECHRSQFGDMHNLIAKKFKKTNFIGFTGTPIFDENKINNNNYKQKIKNIDVHHSTSKTTNEIFGKCLHKYQIKDAIKDGNVLQFRYFFINTIKLKNTSINDDSNNEMIKEIDKESLLNDPKRIEQVTNHIVKSFDKYTNRQKINNNKFNAMFAVSSIDAAKLYYSSFKKNNPNNLKITTIFSSNPNKAIKYLNCEIEDENNENFEGLNEYQIDFLNEVISDFEKMFNMQIAKDSNGYRDFHKIVSKKIKELEIDLIIVVNMFLTGFDAPKLNTLFIDKWVKMHGLVQAFSRTNRIYDKNKSCGNIVSFRPLKNKIDEAMLIFGSDNIENTNNVIVKKTFNEYFNGYIDENGNHMGYKELINKIENIYMIEEKNLDDKTKKEFISLMNEFLNLNNDLLLFDEYKKVKISDDDFNKYKIMYYNIQDYFRNKDKNEKTNINDEVIYETELLKYIDIDEYYIIDLIQKIKIDINYDFKKIYNKISNLIDSSGNLRSKKELILNFINELQENPSINYIDYIKNVKYSELTNIINQFNLDKNKTESFINRCFKRKYFETIGGSINDLIHSNKISVFNSSNDKKNNNDVLEKRKNIESILRKFYEKYVDYEISFYD